MREQEALAATRALWQQYLALTRELLKFIDRQDIDTFLSLVSQRGTLIERMKALPECGFRKTEECRQMVAEIQPMDMQIIYKAKTWLNKSRRQNSTVRAYSLAGKGALPSTGNILNRKF